MTRFLVLLSAILLTCSCVYHDLPVDCSQTGLFIEKSTAYAASKCGVDDGSISVSVKAGRPPYVFSLDKITWQTDSTFLNVGSGVYTVFVKDANGCEDFFDQILVIVQDADIFVSSTPDNSCLSGSGTITINANGTNGPYTFRIEDGSFASQNYFDELQQGSYLLYVRDKNNCTAIVNATVAHGYTGVSWQQDILPIMTNSCATQGCHDGITRLDWRKYDDVKQYAAAIKKRTQDKSMPFDGTLPQDQIDKIACWVDDGALNN